MRAAIDRMLTPFGNRLTFAENLGQASTISARNTFDAILATAGHVDSLSAMQVMLLGRLRARPEGDPERDQLLRLVQLTVNGIAGGLQATG